MALDHTLPIHTWAQYEIWGGVVVLLICCRRCWMKYLLEVSLLSPVWQVPLGLQQSTEAWEDVWAAWHAMVKGNVPLSNYINYKLPLRGTDLHSILCSQKTQHSQNKRLSLTKFLLDRLIKFRCFLLMRKFLYSN